jgi:hypothetical protein
MWRCVFLGPMCVLGAALLVGCGGSSSSTASTARSTQAATTATAAATTTSTTVAPRPSAPSGSASSGAKSGAASFRVAHGDNSIPDFGGEASASERHRATAALAAFLRARAHGEWAKVCTYLAGTIRREMERFGKSSGGKATRCGTAIESLSGAGPAALRADPLTGGVVAVRVKGKSAFVLFLGPHGSKYVMPMQNEAGAWKVTQTAPLTYPLGTPSANP